MDNGSWIAVVGLGLTIAINAGGYLVAWGVMKNSVTALSKRVDALEIEAKAIGEIRVQIGKLEAQMVSVLEQLRDLNANLRWMRQEHVPEEAAPARARRRS